MNDVNNFIKNLNIKSEYVVCAISGGPDSMFLLKTLLSLKDELNFKIVVAHVHHNLRKESDDEALNLEKFCKDNNLIFEIKKIEKYPNNKFSEEAARKIRYEFFDETVEKYNSDILFTAHHGEDLIETILMRLVRGSNLKGYAGFERISYDRGYKIARPLIYLTKVDIVKYLEDNNIWYAIDLSNSNEKYTRNRYRKNILPALNKENKNVHYKFLEYNERLLLADKYLKKVTDVIYNDVVTDNYINVLKFNKLDEIIKIYILEKYLKNCYKSNITSINNGHIDSCILYMKNKNNVVFDLPLNKKGIIEYNKFRILNKIENQEYEYEFDNFIMLFNGKKIKIDNSTNDSSNYVIHLNSKEIKLPFHVRNKKNGDIIKIKNMVGTKKVSDIFTNSKVPKEERAMYPIVTDDTGEIIWIPGIKKSHLDRKKSGKYDIILKYD